MHSESASLQALPDEILEAVLVTCAENGHAETVATIATTSRRLHSTIYGVHFFSLCLMIQELSAIMILEILVSTLITHTVT